MSEDRRVMSEEFVVDLARNVKGDITKEEAKVALDPAANEEASQ